MKKMKKLLSLVLTVAMVVAMGITTFAATNYTITAPATDHQYEIYQIFTGDLAEENGTKILSNVKWGKNGTGTEGEKVAEAILTELKDTTGTDSAKLAVIKKYAKLTSTPVATITKGATYSATAGYYLIKDKDNSLDPEDADAYTTYIVEVVGDTTITPKSDVPTVEKKVKEKNDTTDIETGWQDAADYDIGDNVPFQLTGTMPSKLDDYSKYSYTFTDTLSTGLTRCEEKDVHVYLVNGIDKTEVTSSFKISDVTTNNQFTVSCSNVKAISGVTKDSKFVVEYTATLNDNAKIGSTGNPNKVDLTFSNNPNGEGTGKTPEDKVIVFTYKIVANKVGEDGRTPLKGAGFTLYKYVPEKQKDGSSKLVKKVVKVFENSDDKETSFEFKGIDAGKYVLEETKVPSKYNKAEDIEFEVVATYDETAENPQLKSLEITNGGAFNFETTKVTGDDEHITTNGTATTTIVNKIGSLLPSTGGIGTTIFYVIGGILMVGAGVILVSRRRRSK